MASPREVQNTLKKFRAEIEVANREVSRLLETIRELEDVLENFNEDEDLDVSRSIRGEVKRGKREVEELRKNVDKLDRELSDTNRKFSNLAR